MFYRVKDTQQQYNSEKLHVVSELEHTHISGNLSSTSSFCLSEEWCRRKVLSFLPCSLFFLYISYSQTAENHTLFLRKRNVPPFHGMISYCLILASFLLYYTVALEHYSNNIRTRKYNYTFCLTCEFSWISQIYSILGCFMGTSSEYITFDIARQRCVQAFG